MNEFKLSDFEIDYITESYKDNEMVQSALNDYQNSGDKYQNLRKQSYITIKEALAGDESFTVIPLDIVAEVADLTAQAGYGKLMYQGGVEDARFSIDRIKGASKIVKIGKKFRIYNNGKRIGDLFDLSAQAIFDNLAKFNKKVRSGMMTGAGSIMDAEGQTLGVDADGCPLISTDDKPDGLNLARIRPVKENMSFSEFLNESLEDLKD